MTDPKFLRLKEDTIMSVENYIDLYAESPSEVIGLLQKLYPSSPNKSKDKRSFLNDHINAYVHTYDERTIQWMNEDYGVNVNHSISLRYFSSSDCNSAKERMYIMKELVRRLSCDLLYQPNGDSPFMIRRSGILIFDSYFDRYFGEGSSDILHEENRISITEDMSMEEIMERCEKKFGDSFNWRILPENMRDGTFVSELKTELGEDDPFFGGKIYAVYKCDANDDMLFLSKGEDGHELWRIYHLTYSHCRECEGFPRRTDFASGYEAAKYIIGHFIEENTYM